MYLPNNTLLHAGSYRIVRFLSSGGFGCTYEAEHTLLHTRLAIKEFFVKDFCNRDSQTHHVTVGTLSKVALTDKLKRKFIDEAIAINQLKHPHIVNVSDVFEENGTAYYVMDYIDGQSLGDMVKSTGPLSEAHAVKYIRHVAEALRYVHSKNRLHLDIKPGNIMVDADDNAILIDFGASKQYDEENGENTSSIVGRTPGYAPLEQMGHTLQDFTPATDIYALGATLYKLLSGLTPPEVNVILNSDNALHPLPTHISEATRQAVAVAMQIRSKDRPQNIDTFLALLDAAPVQDAQEEVEATVYECTAPKSISEKPKTQPSPSSEPRPQLNDTSNKLKKKNRIPFPIIFLTLIVIGLLWLAPRLKGSINDAPNEFIQNEYVDSRKAVDLGLSVRWADHNVGASSPEDYGEYYAWGETNIKDVYFSTNSTTYNLNLSGLTSMNITNSDGRLTPLYDAATQKWGEYWRMPTEEEWEELVNQCNWYWTTRNETAGYEITGPNGNSIFLPAAGWRSDTTLYKAGGGGYYWSSYLHQTRDNSAMFCIFDPSDYKVGSDARSSGNSIRPVTDY